MRNSITNSTITTGRLALAALVIALAGGCATYTDYESFVHDPEPKVTSSEYRLAPPDQITIYSKRVREINGHVEIIRPDGKITLPLLGSVYVAGKTPEEVSASLKTMAQEYYADADVTLQVTGFNSKKIFVFGEVSAPGPYSYVGTNTILETLARAQPTRLADKGRVQVLRPNKKGELVRRMTIDLNDMAKRGDTSLDAVLEERDIIYVPPTVLAAAGLALQQVLLPIQPAAATVKGPADIYTYGSGAPYSRE